MIPRSVWIWSASLAVGRFLAFYALYANQSHDAQWQLSYFPLWIIDFPISVLAYFVFELPIPTAEAIIGPLWWFSLPIIFWLLRRRWRRHREARGK